MRDHIGGGFHRYSVDAEWRVPHFEKMLYDQAQLVLAYLEAARSAATSSIVTWPRTRSNYVAREMTAPDGAFIRPKTRIRCALRRDRDVVGQLDGAHVAEKREGAFYVWTAAEIDRLSGSDAAVVRRRFGVEDAGNALADPQGEFVGQNILYIAQSWKRSRPARASRSKR